VVVAHTAHAVPLSTAPYCPAGSLHGLWHNSNKNSKRQQNISNYTQAHGQLKVSLRAAYQKAQSSDLKWYFLVSMKLKPALEALWIKHRASSEEIRVRYTPCRLTMTLR